MAQRFLTAGADFLVKLVAAVRKKAADIEDDELSQAIPHATKRNQVSEALWLSTVPVAVVNIRQHFKPRPQPKLSRDEQAELDALQMKKPPTPGAYLKQCSICRKKFNPRHPSESICGDH